MVSDQEWLPKMEERFLMLVEEKEGKEFLFPMKRDLKGNSI